MIASDLNLLREKDPGTWEKIARGIPLQPCGQYMIFSGGEIRTARYHEAYMPFSQLLPEVALAWLQAVLQDAIRARGWLLKLSTFSARPYACIWKPEDAIYVARRYYGAGESLADALLKAYLEAIGWG